MAPSVALLMTEQINAEVEQQKTLSASFNELAKLFCAQQKYEEAEALYSRALTVEEKALGEDHPGLIPSISRLAIVYRIQEKFDAAEPLCVRALELARNHYGPDDLRTAQRLNCLAGLANGRRDFARAEELIRQSLVIYDKRLGSQHRTVGLAYLSLALVKQHTGDVKLADQFFDRFIYIVRQASDATDQVLHLAEIFYKQSRFDDAELLFRYCLLLGEEEIWPDHPFVASALNGLARWHVAQGQYDLAAPLYTRVLKITENIVGEKHSSLEPILKNCAIALYHCDQSEEAVKMEKRAADIRAEQELPTDVATVIGEKYQIIKILGKGGMSTVYQARHQLTNKVVAVKMLNVDLLEDKNSFRRFHLEAKASAALNHPNVVAVHDFGSTPEGIPYIVMDYLDGNDLKVRIKEAVPISFNQAVKIFIQCCDALVTAHEAGVVHRDLKPGNIMLVTQNREVDVVKIVDLGIAKLLPLSGVDVFDLTQSGQVFGSPTYMSPEQARGDLVDHRSDIYSLGCVMYEFLTGRPPFQGTNALAVLHKHLSEEATPMAQVGMRTANADLLDPIVLRCLAKEPAKRYQSMLELKQDLEQLNPSALRSSSVSGTATTRTETAANPDAGGGMSDWRVKAGLAAVAAGCALAAVATYWQMTSAQKITAAPQVQSSPATAVAQSTVAQTAPVQETPQASPPEETGKGGGGNGGGKGDNAEQTAESRINRIATLAAECHANGQCNEAEGYFKEALAISEKVFGKNSPKTRERVRELALFYESMGEQDKAQPFRDRYLKMK